jgi:hypothetical protein
MRERIKMNVSCSKKMACDDPPPWRRLLSLHLSPLRAFRIATLSDQVVFPALCGLFSEVVFRMASTFQALCALETDER